MYFTLDPLGAKPLLRHKGGYAHLFNPKLFFSINFELVIKSCMAYYASICLCSAMSSHHVYLNLGPKL